jgi:hypothetical protein
VGQAHHEGAVAVLSVRGHCSTTGGGQEASTHGGERVGVLLGG